MLNMNMWKNYSTAQLKIQWRWIVTLCFNYLFSLNAQSKRCCKKATVNLRNTKILPRHKYFLFLVKQPFFFPWWGPPTMRNEQGLNAVFCCFRPLAQLWFRDLHFNHPSCVITPTGGSSRKIQAPINCTENRWSDPLLIFLYSYSMADQLS